MQLFSFISALNNDCGALCSTDILGLKKSALGFTYHPSTIECDRYPHGMAICYEGDCSCSFTRWCHFSVAVSALFLLRLLCFYIVLVIGLGEIDCLERLVSEVLSGTVNNRIFICPDALLTDFFIEFSDTKNSPGQDGIGFGPASCHDA